MAQPTEKNHLFYGDNLEVLRQKSTPPVRAAYRRRVQSAMLHS